MTQHAFKIFIPLLVGAACLQGSAVSRPLNAASMSPVELRYSRFAEERGFWAQSAVMADVDRIREHLLFESVTEGS